MSITASPPPIAMRRLEWDSAHFGLPVAEISDVDLTDDGLRCVLSAARTQGLRVVYWATRQGRSLPAELLAEFGGAAINHRVKFTAPLESLGDVCDESDISSDTKHRISEFPRGPAPQELLDLSIVAGHQSRFQVDHRLPEHKFRSLYETWMTRSTLRELADVVLVARSHDRDDEVVGVVTVSETAGAGQIGLLAVHEAHRGQGIGSSLMRATLSWLRERGATELSVVTQLENRAACGLYSRWNLHPTEVRLWFHFRLPDSEQET